MAISIKFLDSNGNEINELPTSYSNIRNFNIEIVGEGTQTIYGDILLIEDKIGELIWTPAEGSKARWYAGSSSNTPVKSGDFFNVVIYSPVNLSRSLPVNRPQPTITASEANTLATTIRKLKDSGLSNVSDHKVLHTLVTQMNDSHGHLGFTTRPDSIRNIKKIQEHIADSLELPQINLLAYSNSTETSNAISTKVPPSSAQIFATWDRFSNNNHYPGGVGAADAADAWVWNETLQAAVQPLNTNFLNGFISLELLENYEIDVIVQSNNTDDDMNGVVLAFNRENNINYFLAVHIHQGGNGPVFSHSIGHYAGTSGTRVTLTGTDFAGRNKNTTGATGTDTQGWNNRFTRVKATRQGNYFKVLASNWNSMELNPISLMEVTLDDSVELSRFKNPRQWGFMNQSQAQSFFQILSAKGAIDYSILVNAVGNQVYRYTGTSWESIPGLSLKKLFGAPRKIRNPETGKIYQIATNGTVTLTN